MSETLEATNEAAASPDPSPTAAPDSAPSSSPEVLVRAEGLCKTFRDFWQRPRVTAVDDITFEVRRGEVFGLLGPNGSGKSTTIKMILGLLFPTGGELEVFGGSPRDVRTKSRLGYLPEESYLYTYLNAQETLDFYGKLFNLGADERRKRIDELLEMVGLPHARKRLVGEYSKGMQRRIGLAQAIINNPDLVILDEPTSGLDPIGTRQVKDLILHLKANGKTVILSSHLLADVEDVCDRITILYGGRVQAAGPINELLRYEDRHQINLPELAPEQLRAVLDAVREKLGAEPDVEQPSRNLEQFFLEVVSRARSEMKEQAGTGPEADMAGYLGEGSE